MKKKIKSKNMIKVVVAIVVAGIFSLGGNIASINAISNINSKDIQQSDGWTMQNNKWYYYQNAIKKTGWLKENSNWYWLKSDGTMASKEWVSIDGTWYMFYENGKMFSNEWYKDNNSNWYWLKSSGAMASNEWYKDNNSNWYWLKSGGNMASDEWVSINGTWYMFYGNGKMFSNEWYRDCNGNWYWLKSGGAMASNELIKINNVWYKFEASGNYKTKNSENIARINECDFLNVRKGASSNDSIVGCVYTGEYVEILEKSYNGWYKIQSGKMITGWVNSKYITVQSDTNSRTAKVIEVAKNQIGKPYEWGGDGPNSFDCSGLTSYAYKQGANVTLPRVSREQANVGTSINKADLKSGDLIFFAADGKSVNHVALYIGNSQYIHAPRPGEFVRVDKTTTSYFANNYFSAKRIIN